jgi:hypothetical protein
LFEIWSNLIIWKITGPTILFPNYMCKIYTIVDKFGEYGFIKAISHQRGSLRFEVDLELNLSTIVCLSRNRICNIGNLNITSQSYSNDSISYQACYLIIDIIK